jgi:hypothetical protein
MSATTQKPNRDPLVACLSLIIQAHESLGRYYDEAAKAGLSGDRLVTLTKGFIALELASSGLRSLPDIDDLVSARSPMVAEPGLRGSVKRRWN